jgi:hypothetical protein
MADPGSTFLNPIMAGDGPVRLTSILVSLENATYLPL